MLHEDHLVLLLMITSTGHYLMTDDVTVDSTKKTT